MEGCRAVDDAYEQVKQIGEGTYGVVWMGRCIATDEVVALKRIRMEYERDGLPITSLREIKLLQRLQHPNIVQLKEVCLEKRIESKQTLDNGKRASSVATSAAVLSHTQRQEAEGTKGREREQRSGDRSSPGANAVVLVFEYVHHDLCALMDSMKKPFTESAVKCILQQALRALAYLHERWVIHRDIKLSNMLLSNVGCLKLCDFGLARSFGMPANRYTPKVVTLWYRAPELLFGAETYAASLDMWSMGCVMGELLAHRPLMPGENEMHQVKLICNMLGTPTERIWPSLPSFPLLKKVTLPKQPYNNLSAKFPLLSAQGVDLLNQMLTYDPAKRITARQALSHRYFSEAPLPCPPEMLPTFPSLHASGDDPAPLAPGARASRRSGSSNSSNSSSSAVGGRSDTSTIRSKGARGSVGTGGVVSVRVGGSGLGLKRRAHEMGSIFDARPKRRKGDGDSNL